MNCLHCGNYAGEGEIECTNCKHWDYSKTCVTSTFEDDGKPVEKTSVFSTIGKIAKGIVFVTVEGLVILPLLLIAYPFAKFGKWLSELSGSLRRRMK